MATALGKPYAAARIERADLGFIIGRKASHATKLAIAQA